MSDKKILLVEDDIDLRENMVMLLEYEGYKVTEAEDGAQALSLLETPENSLPDLIVLDLFMPVMNGREFLDVIATRSNIALGKIPVVVVTASEASAQRDLESRTKAVLRKPIDVGSFLDLISSIMN